MIAASARKADVLEMQRLGTTVEKAMTDGMEVSEWSATGLWQDEPVCMFGVNVINYLNGVGAPWMIGTEKLLTCEKAFLRRCRRVVEAMQMTCPNLINAVDAENEKAIQWLRWLGFEFHEGEEGLVNGHRFLMFRKGDFNV